MYLSAVMYPLDLMREKLINIETGEVIEFQNAEIEKLQEEIARKLGFKLMDHRLELYATPLKKD